MGWLALFLFVVAVGLTAAVLIRRGRCIACELLNEKCRLRQAARRASAEGPETPAQKE